jgi:hypothetical protein
VTDLSFTELLKINDFCEKINAKMIACNVYGNIGYIFNDFLNYFEIEDVDGEDIKEVFFEKRIFQLMYSSE